MSIYKRINDWASGRHMLPQRRDEGRGVDVVLAQAAQAPVILRRLGEAIVVEQGGVCGADETVGNGTAEKHGEDVVGDEIVLGLVPGQDDEGLIYVEVFVVQQGV